MRQTTLLCLECGSEGPGEFCSHCGKPFPTDPHLFIPLAVRRLVANGFRDLATDPPGPPAIPDALAPVAKHLPTLLYDLEEFGDDRYLKLISLVDATSWTSTLHEAVVTSLARLEAFEFWHGSRLRHVALSILLVSHAALTEVEAWRLTQRRTFKISRPEIRWAPRALLKAIARRFEIPSRNTVGSWLAWFLNPDKPPYSLSLDVAPVDVPRARAPFILDTSGPLRQALLQVRRPPPPSAGAWTAGTVLQLAASTVSHHFEAFTAEAALLFRPSHLAHRIRTDRIGAATVASFLVGTALLATVVDHVATHDRRLEIVSMPALNELVLAGLIGVLVFAEGIMVHAPLKWGGGRGRFRHTVLGLLYVNGALLPFAVLWESYAERQPGLHDMRYWLSGAMVFIVAKGIMEVVHGIGSRRASVIMGSTALFWLAIGLAGYYGFRAATGGLGPG